MKRIILLIVVIGAATSTLTAATPDVMGVTAQQRYPWNGLVDIVVTMEGAADDVAQTECAFVATNIATGAAIPVTHVLQKGADAGSGTTWSRRYIWNATNDVGIVKIDDLALTVVVQVNSLGGIRLWEGGPYWAECNVGASKPEEYGYYFWWGDTVGYKPSNKGWISAKDGSEYSYGSESSFSSATFDLNNSQLQAAGYIDSVGNLMATYDAATAHLAAPWRMPTIDEFSELIYNYCDTTWTTRNGVSGCLVTGRGAYASKSIFLPAAGVGTSFNSPSYLDSHCYYWSSTPWSEYTACARNLWCTSSDCLLALCLYRYNVASVRPVRGFATNGAVVSGVGATTHLKLDCRTGVRAWSTDGEILRYDASWYEKGEMVRITDNGTVVATGASGVYNWKPEAGSSSSHIFKLEVLSNARVINTETVLFAPASVVARAITAHQRYPWNGLVDIVVTMEGTAEELAEAECVFGAINSVTKAVVPITSITQKGADTSSGTTWTRKFVWDAAKDVGEVKIDDLALTVEASTDCVRLWQNGPLWAKCNVGATKPEEYGYYFWWGDTVGYKRSTNNDSWISVKDGATFLFSSENCPTYGKSNSQLRAAGFIDSMDNLMAAHDAATVHLGAPWRMPTDAEISALISNCDTRWTTCNGVMGRLVSGRGTYASKSIFLPAAGYGANSCLYSGLDGYCLSSTPKSDYFARAWILYFGSGYFHRSYIHDRCYGQSVRPLRGFATSGTMVSCVGVTTKLKLDCRKGVREPDAQGEVLRYDASWYDNAEKVRISYNGAVVAAGVAGSYPWHMTSSSSSFQYSFKLEALSAEGEIVGTETAQFALGYIRNVTARQLWPHKKIEVCYTLANDIYEVAGEDDLLVLGVSGGKTNVARSVVGTKTICAGRHCMVWDLDADDGVIENGDFAVCVYLGRLVQRARDSFALSGGESVTYSVTGSGILSFKGRGPSDGFFCSVDGAAGASAHYVRDYNLADYQINISGTVKHTIVFGAYSSAWGEVKDLRWNGISLESDCFEVGRGGQSSVVLSGGFAAVCDGMDVEVPAGLVYSPIDAGSVTLEVNGTAVHTATESGTHIWTPEWPGMYVHTHIAGTNTFTRKVVCPATDDAKELEIGWLGMPVSNYFPNVYASVRKIIIAQSMKQLSAGVFAGCTSLTSLTLPPGLADFGLDVMPEQLQSSLGLRYDADGFMIYDGWLLDYKNKSATSLVVPEGVIGIGHSALSGMYDLETVSLPNSLRYIAKGAFANDSYLDNVIIPTAVEAIGDGAFENCSWMQTITMPGGVKKIGARAFAGCTKLAQISVSDRLTEVGDCAFSNCWRMTSVAFPLSCASVASTAFEKCIALTGVTTPTHGGSMAEWFAPVYKQVKTVTVPAGETMVGNRMFKDCTALTTVTFADGGEDVVSIGDEAFSGCTQLTGFMFPEGLKTIGNASFLNCYKLRELVFGDSLFSIGDSAFKGCSWLNRIILPNSLTRIGVSSFEGCGTVEELSLSTSLEEIPDRAFYGTSGWMMEESKSGCGFYDVIIVPASVKVVGNDAFGGTSRTYQSRIYYLGDAPAYSNNVYRSYYGASYVIYGTKGWDGRPTSRDLPQSWPVDNVYSRTIKAWSPNRFDVTFDAAGGKFESIGKSTCVVQETASAAYVLPTEVPTRKGYRFNGWWDSQNGGTRIGSVKATKAHTVYAQWIETETLTLTIRLEANGGTVSPSGIERDVGAKYGTLPEPVRDHYAFDGWWTEDNGGVQVTESTKVQKSARAIYARWKYAEYEIRFHADDGTSASGCQYFILGETVVLRKGALQRHGYELSGWATRSGGPVVYADGQAVREFATRVGKTVDLYAVWEHIGYWISWNRNGGQGWMEEQFAHIGETVTLDPCAYTRTGYTFAGWATTSSGHVAYKDEDTVVDLAETKNAKVELFAVWKKRGDICTVFFDANGGNEVDAMEAVKGESIGMLPTAVRLGYSLEGWYTMKSGGERVTETTKVTADVTYYAHWKKLDTKGAWFGDAVSLSLGKAWKSSTAVLVPEYDPESGYNYGKGVYYYSFVLKRGEGCRLAVAYDASYSYDEEYSGPYIDRVFVYGETDAPYFDSDNGWAISPADWDGWSASAATYCVRIVGDVGQNFTFSCRLFNGFAWVDLDCRGGEIDDHDETCESVTLLLEKDLSVGEGLKNYYGSYGSQLAKCASFGYWTPKRSRHTFEGWFTEPSGGTKATEKTKVEGDATWYAHWTYDGSAYVSVAVHDDCAGMGTVTGGNKSFKAGAKVALKATATKGNVFVGWFDENGEPLSGDVDYRSPSYTYVATGEDDIAISARFIPVEDDWVTVECAVDEEYARGEAIEPIVLSLGSGSLATVKVTGLPTGLKFTAKALGVKATKTTAAAHYEANTIYGTPTKSGVYVATVTATTAGKKTATETVKFVVRGVGESIVDVGWDATQGKVAGAGVYAEGKKATLKAIANKGYVFMGWYESGDLVSRLASHVLTMPGHDVSLEANFISSEEDRAAIAAAVADEFWFDADNLTAEKTVSAGVYLEWPIAAEALSAATVKVAGLPNGLKFTAKDVVDSKTKEVLVPANTIYGTPSAASKIDKSGKVTPSAVKITVTTAGKNSQTFQIDTTVVALPERVVGTFTGGAAGDTPGSASLTVAASGKISGKWISDGKTWTLAASGFMSGDPDGCQFETTLTAKCGKETREISLAVTSEGVASTDLFTAYWANWKVEPWKTIGKAMANKKYTFYVSEDGSLSTDSPDSTYGTIVLTATANGTLKATGAFVIGIDSRTGKETVYKPTGSVVLTPMSESKYLAFVYFPSKGNFGGFASMLKLMWDGEIFSCNDIGGCCGSGTLQKISRHKDSEGFEDWYWETFVTVKRGESHTFCAKDLTASTAITDVEVWAEYTYKEDGETYEDCIYASESCEKKNSAGGFDKYVLLTAEDWDYVPESKSSLKFKVRVYGWESDEGLSTADISFKYGHSAGTVCYPDVAQEPVESEPES